MSEYYYILSLYKNKKRYLTKLILLSALLLGVASFIAALDIFRISPFIWYVIAMGIVLFQMKKMKPESEYYHQLIEFLQNYQPEILQNDVLVFFVDYQLKHYFDYEAGQLFARLKNKNTTDDAQAIADLNEIIGEITAYYNYIAYDQQLKEDIEISLQWYRNSIENRKQDLV
ncbi:hypothetical protein P3T75_10460 [Enterococcus montenegrensis]|uniref:hypothetical protein n=1 Tax=Enterococcus TaxID=1350 RepID=UPI001E604880|nr:MULTISPECIES: hypothetical protein [Enterococcus]MCD1024685.1 hypothetical protein [Enterococcus sp. SMC-9]WHA08725.1 hypothetical protein P3T75_10460 [Enterococcus montenegrensis]